MVGLSNMIRFGCVKKYCNEDISLIENYEKALADKEQTWHCHHRRENISSRKELIEKNEYYNRPAEELIFMTHSEHTILHFKGKKCNPFTKEHKQKISKALKGHTISEETKRKISDKHKGKPLSEESKKKMAVAFKALHWFNNGIKNVRARECPSGFVKGRLKRN